MEIKTKLNQVEVALGDIIQVRLSLVVENKGMEVSSQNHRTSIPKGGDIDAQFKAVNAHLGTMGFPPVADEDIKKVKNIAAAVWA